MAAVASAAPAVDTTGLLQNLSLGSETKTHDVAEVNKKPASIENGPANGGGEAAIGGMPKERSLTPVLPDIIDYNMCYVPNGYPSPAYYYGGYDGSTNEWDEYSKYISRDGMEMLPGMYGDMYHHGYGYAPYGAYPSPASPVPTVGHDGQIYGPHPYQYPAPFYQTPTVTNASKVPNQTSTTQTEVSTSPASDKPVAPIDTAKTGCNGIVNGIANRKSGSAPFKKSQQYVPLTSNGSYVKGALPGGLPAMPFFDGPVYSNGQHRPSTPTSMPYVLKNANTPLARNQSQRPLPHLTGMHASGPTPGMGPIAPGFVNRFYPSSRLYNPYGNSLKTGFGFAPNGFYSRTNGCEGLNGNSKYKPRSQGNLLYGLGYESQDGFCELKRGPRGNGFFKNQKPFGPLATAAVKGLKLSSTGKEDSSDIVPNKEQFNREDFAVKYSDAKFFIIKSYSEDDVHKSIKYNVWTSTPNGNKKLDAAYQEAQARTGGCPIFLFFSVNTSGQFVGVAEMVGLVDFNKTVDYWQQDKWHGCFSVKWHVVKDVPNSILKHITLENNENKPVTNSRDTQEVRLEQGLEMLKIFKDHVIKTSILDDFEFYENRQKLMQERRGKLQLMKKPLGPAPILNIETVRNGGLGEEKLLQENGVASAIADASEAAEPLKENRAVANGVANGC
ncbi:uncharacterized protein LOC109704697 isoform X2 [Ananas comosus]|uniref:YTH domain-containing family protein n=1 Tax=Ananas comosus TaxID=4615 RepID=A0A6P5ECT0_ANACO|nr:uncharacterized protein LOC109704697 isoform X2 [Ananas comosus]